MRAFLLAVVEVEISGLVFSYFLRTSSVAGGSPAATHFSCFAKKSKQKKATAGTQPLRGSRCCRIQIGKRTKLASLKQRSFLIRFGYGIIGCVQAESASVALAL